MDRVDIKGLRIINVEKMIGNEYFLSDGVLGLVELGIFIYTSLHFIGFWVH